MVRVKKNGATEGRQPFILWPREGGCGNASAASLAVTAGHSYTIPHRVPSVPLPAA